MYPARLRAKGMVVVRAFAGALPLSTAGGPMESTCRSWCAADGMIDDVVVGVDEEDGAVGVGGGEGVEDEV